MNFEITPSRGKIHPPDAARRRRPGAGFRLAVSPGGCSGLRRRNQRGVAPASAGRVRHRINGVKLFLPAESRLLLDGVTIDFVDTPAKTGSGLSSSRPERARVRRTDARPVEAEDASDDADRRSSAHRNDQCRKTRCWRIALLGGGLPSEAEEHLLAAGLSYQHDDVAEAHLRQAEALAPDHAAVLIGLYRFYFYKGRLHEALGDRRAMPRQGGSAN